MRLSRRSLVLGALALSACSPRAPAVAASSEPIVETAQGKARGIAADGVFTFKGLRYGASTAGANRFLPPQPPQKWAGVVDAFEYGDASPQNPGRPGVKTMSDDCLRINVWTPGLDDTKRPVLLWFHGGGFESGSGSSPLYDGRRLAKRGDVVIATINHRLNVYGHCYLGGALGPDFAQSGNAGYLDLVAAMQWVRDNIAAFGGDPGKVTIFGQSGGGRKVSLCYAGKSAQGLFHRGVVQSGSHLQIQTTEQADELTQRLLHEFNLKPADARKLQEIPVDQLSAAQAKVNTEMEYRFAPVLDNVTFDAHPFLPNAPAISSNIPMMLGTNRTELTNQLGNTPGIFELDEKSARERLAAYIKPADVDEAIATFRASRPEANWSEIFFTIASARGYCRDQTIMAEKRVEAAGPAPTFVYRLMWRQPVEGGRRVSQHSLDLPFIFDNVAAGANMTGPETASTTAMANAMSEAWLAFARTGDPNHAGLPKWSAYDLERRNTMLFDDPPTSVDDPHKAERLFMARYPSQQTEGLRAIHRLNP